MPLETWDKLYGVNVSGVFLSCQVEARVMLPRRKGLIINVASMSGSIVNRGLLQVHYNSSKAAVDPHVEESRHGWSERGLRVNAISPGYTLTPDEPAA